MTFYVFVVCKIYDVNLLSLYTRRDEGGKERARGREEYQLRGG